MSHAINNGPASSIGTLPCLQEEIGGVSEQGLVSTGKSTQLHVRPSSGKIENNVPEELTAGALPVADGGNSFPGSSLREPKPLTPSAANALDAALAANAGNATVDITQLMQALYKFAQLFGNAQRLMRTQQMDIGFTALWNAAKEIRQAAKNRFSASITQGVTQIGGGAFVAVQSVRSLATATESFRTARTVGRMPQNSPLAVSGNAKVKELDRLSQYQSETGRASSDAMAGFGSIGGASFEREGKLNDADQAELDARSKKQDALAQDAADSARKMEEMMQSVRDTMSAVNRAHSDAITATARNI